LRQLSTQTNYSILLVSADYKILLVLRTFRPTIPQGADPIQFQTYETDEIYRPLQTFLENPDSAKKFEKMTRGRLEGILFRGQVTEVVPEEEGEVNALMPLGVSAGVSERKDGGKARDVGGQGGKKFKKKEKEGRNTLRKVLLVGAAEYGSQLIEEMIRSSGIEGNILVKDLSEESTPPPKSPLSKSIMLMSV
jgi:hypothetical protein